MLSKLLNRWKSAQLSEKEYYTKRREKWESTENYENFLRENLKLSFNIFKEKSVLEIGCGCSGLIFYINQGSPRIGIDPLVNEYKYNLFCKEECEVLTAIGEAIPFKDNTFDIAICGNVIDHMMSPHSCLNELYRVLKVGGILIFYLNIFKMPKILLKVLNIVGRPHTSHFNDIEIIELLEKNKLSIEYLFIKKNILGSGLKKELAVFFGGRPLYAISKKL